MPVRLPTEIFGAARAALFAIDSIEFLLTPRPGSMKSSAPGPWQPNAVALRELAGDDKMGREEGQSLATIRDGGFVFRQSLAAYRGGDGRRIYSFAKPNILRRVRAKLVEAGKYRIPPGTRWDRDEDNNYVHPEFLAPDVNLHEECLADLQAAIAEAATRYAEHVSRLFDGVRLTAGDVHATLNQIELTWDATSPIAMFVPRLLEDGWRGAFRGASRKLGVLSDVEEVATRVATDDAEPKAPRGLPVLRADGARGNGAKLYVKAQGIVRFEVELTGKRIAHRLGKTLNLADAEGVRAGLETLAQEPYDALLDAQAACTPESVLLVSDVLGSFGGPRFHGVAGILQVFEAGGVFHHSGGTHEDLLDRLKKQGLVKKLKRGYWGPTPAVARFFEFHAHRSRLPIPSVDTSALVAAPPTALIRTRRSTPRTPPTLPASREGNDAP